MKSIVAIALAVLALFSGAVSAQDTIEKKIVEFLLSAVENLKVAKFTSGSSIRISPSTVEVSHACNSDP